MGIERARVVEVHAADPTASRGGSGYQIDDRLVLTCAGVVGRGGEAVVRAAGTAPWVPAEVVWRDEGAGAALVEVDDPMALLPLPSALRWGDVVGGRPVGVMSMGFASADRRPEWPRDPVRVVGQMTPDGSLAPVDDGMRGAALFAGAEVVGVVVADRRAVPVRVLAGDPEFVSRAGGGRGLALHPVGAPSFGLPILGGNA